MRSIKAALREEDADDQLSASKQTGVTRLSKTSVDAQIDSYILKFETESQSDSDDMFMSEFLRRCSLRMLLEADDETAPTVPDAPAPTDAEPPTPPTAGADDAVIDDEDPSDDASPDISGKNRVKIDVDAFTRRVARLIFNQHNLLDVQTVILNRARNFLKSNYDKAHVDKMIDILDTEFDFKLDPERDAKPGEFFGVTGPGGQGGLGGGGGAE